MDDDTITFLRTLCGKVKEIATNCDAYLENQSRKNRKILPKEFSDDPKPIGNRLIPISKWKDFHPWPTAGSLRSMIFSSYKTGADYFVRKVDDGISFARSPSSSGSTCPRISGLGRVRMRVAGMKNTIRGSFLLLANFNALFYQSQDDYL